jgi:hypothetical protein
VESEEPVKVNFHPSCLLTIGDCLAFSRELSTTQPCGGGQAAAPGPATADGGGFASGSGSRGHGAVTGAHVVPERGDEISLKRAGSFQPPARLMSLERPSQQPPLHGSRVQTPPLRRALSGSVSFAPDGAARRGDARRETDDATGGDDAGGGGAAGAGAGAPVVVREAPPSMHEQMALGSCITSRVPQRCAPSGI